MCLTVRQIPPLLFQWSHDIICLRRSLIRLHLEKCDFASAKTLLLLCISPKKSKSLIRLHLEKCDFASAKTLLLLCISPKKSKLRRGKGVQRFSDVVLRCRVLFLQKRKPETSSDFHTLYFSAFSFSAIHSSTMFSIVRNCAAVSFRILSDKRS